MLSSGRLTVLAADPAGSEPKNPEAIASVYVVDLVATAAFGVAMNDAGDVTGTSYPDPGCGSSCLPPLETVVWKSGERIVLPSLPGLNGVTTTDINNLGWISGFSGLFGFGHAAAWKPDGSTYTPIDMGLLPGTTSSIAIGIDDNNRAVGVRHDIVRRQHSVYVERGWRHGQPRHAGLSRGNPARDQPGWNGGHSRPLVSSRRSWQCDNGDLTPLGASCWRTQPWASTTRATKRRFLVTTSGENLDYPFRYHNGTWQQISFIPTGHLSSYGVGSINDAQDITATVQSTGMIAAGPSGLLQDLADLVSPAYAGSALTTTGPMNASGQILARMIIGQSGQRLVKLVPGQPCTSNCIQVTSIQMKGRGPDRCDQGSAEAQAKLTVKNEAGVPLAGVRVTGHFFDDYWLDETVVGKTNANGQVTFKHTGPPCVGAIAFLVTNAEARPARTFDRTKGILTSYVIPLP